MIKNCIKIKIRVKTKKELRSEERKESHIPFILFFSFRVVKLSVNNQRSRRDISNIIGVIRGKYEKGKWFFVLKTLISGAELTDFLWNLHKLDPNKSELPTKIRKNAKKKKIEKYRSKITALWRKVIIWLLSWNCHFPPPFCGCCHSSSIVICWYR